MKYYSQFGEDQFLYENNYLTDKGIYIDVGSAHPLKLSNTRLLDNLGWKGICIDIDQRWAIKYNAINRKNLIISLIGTREGFEYINLDKEPSLNRKDKPMNLLSVFRTYQIRLATLLQKFKVSKVDLLSVDTEGTEIDVLNSLFNYSKIRPRIIIVEFYTYGTNTNEENLVNYMAQYEYKLIHKTKANLIYISI